MPTDVTASGAQPPLSSIPCLTGLRFWLATWVVVFHQSVPADIHYPLLQGLLRHPVLYFMAHGFVAVTGFFCLSGFILAYNYSHRLGTRAECCRFMGSRLARIYPICFAGLLMFAPIIYVAVDQGKLGPGKALCSLVASLALLQSFSSTLWHIWNGPEWSLSDEMFFYLSLPWYASWLARQSTRTLLGLAGFSAFVKVGLSAALLLLFHVFPAAEHSVWWEAQQSLIGHLARNPVVRVAEFFCGYCTGLLFLRHGAWSARRSTVVLAASLAIFYGCGTMLAPGSYLLPLYIVLFLAIIYALAQPTAWVRTFLGSPTACFLGEISFSMYIFQLPLAIYLEHYMRAHPEQAFWGRHHLLVFAGYFAVLMAFSAVAHVWVEHPLRRKLAPVISRKLKEWLNWLPLPQKQLSPN